MSKVNNISSCQNCHIELSADLVGNSCPNCGFVIKNSPNEFFEGPAYIYLQHEEELGKIVAGKDEKKKRKDEEHLLSSELAWFRKCSDEDRIAALKDAFRVIQALMHSNASPETAQKVSKIGQQIGKLAASVDVHLEAGGYLYGKVVPKPTQPGGSELDS